MANGEGDPLLIDTGVGIDLSIIDGQPVMDEGLRNAVFLSLFGLDWWGNAVSGSDEQLQSVLPKLLTEKLTNQTRLSIEVAAKSALDWLLGDNIAKSVAVSATIPSSGRLDLAIAISQPGRTTNVRYQINWATMEANIS